MGFVSQLVTLIWLIVEQSAAEQPVQTRLGLSGVPGVGRAVPGARDEPGMPQGRAWQPHLHICNFNFSQIQKSGAGIVEA